MKLPRRHHLALAIGTLVVVAAFPLAVLASHQFNDVPDDNTFHADISAIADAGVTTGCGGGNYCPKDYVTREQMAAFLNRLGALAPGKTPVANAAKLDGLTADQFARADVAVTGHYNCTGAVMQPMESGESYSFPGNARQVNAGSAYFACPVVLPNGAVVTKLSGGADDTSATEQVTCSLIRASALSYTGAPSSMAGAGSGDAFAGGDIIFTDTSIDFATIDNALYSYRIHCFVNGNGADILLVGASVEYTIEGLPVP